MLSRIPRTSLSLLLLFLSFVILWRGGKSLDALWLTTALTWLLTVSYWRGKFRAKEAAPLVPWLPWITAMGFVFWTTVVFITSTTRNYGFDEVLRDGSCVALFFWMTRQSMNDTGERTMARIGSVLVSVACIAAVFGIAVYILQPVNRFVGTFFDARFHTDYWPNAWAQFLLLIWPFALLQLLQHRRFALPKLGLLLGALLLSYSRGAFIAFGGQVMLALAATAYVHPMNRSVLERSVKRALAVTAIAVALFFGVNAVRGQFFPVQSVVEKVTFTASEGTSSVSERSQFWNQAWTLFKERPLTGYGPYSFRFVQPRLQQGIFATSDHPHNVFLKLLAERGWPSAVLFALLLLSVLIPAAGLLVRTRSLPPMLAVPLLAVVGVLAHNMIDFNLQFQAIALPFWMFLGGILGYALHHGNVYRKMKKLNTKIARSLELLLASAVLIAAVIETPPMILSSFGRHAEANGDDAQALTWYGAASRELFSRDLLLSRTNLLIKKNRFDEASASLAAYMKQNAEDPRAWSIKAELAEAREEPAAVILSLSEEAYRRNRFNDIRTLTQLLSALQSNPDALPSRRQEFEALLVSYAQAIDHNEHFIALGPNADAFADVATAMAKAYPDGEPGYEILAANVDRKKTEERAKYAERAPGWLW